MVSQIIVELPWNSLMAVIIFFCWYYPIGMYKNAIEADQVHERGALMFLLILMFLLFTSSFSTMIIAAFDTAEAAANVGQLLFSLSLIFCGVLATPTALPGFWIFMYRVSPFTYLVDGMLSVGLANTQVVCSSIEFVRFNPPSNSTCIQYLESYLQGPLGGYVNNPNATTQCELCPLSDTNKFLSSVASSYSNRWRNFGIMWAYVVFNIALALFLYWLARVPRKQKVQEELPQESLSRQQSKVPGAKAE